MRNLTWWLHQFSNAHTARKLGWDSQTISSLAETIKRATPRGWQPAISIKTHHGGWWQAHRDTHPLAIDGRSKLGAVRDELTEHGIIVGSWGEPMDDAIHGGGALAGESAAITGYYCADVEPYGEFSIPNTTLRRVTGDGNRTGPFYTEADAAVFAEQFWAAFYLSFQDASGSPASRENAGVSLVPQPSGLSPFGSAGLRAWVRLTGYVQPQCYAHEHPQLSPDVALPVLRVALKGAMVRARVVPIFDRGAQFSKLLTAHYWRWGADVWRL